jgi:hypothetical protein
VLCSMESANTSKLSSAREMVVSAQLVPSPD